MLIHINWICVNLTKHVGHVVLIKDCFDKKCISITNDTKFTPGNEKKMSLLRQHFKVSKGNYQKGLPNVPFLPIAHKIYILANVLYVFLYSQGAIG